MKIIQFLRPPPPLSIYVPNSSTPLTLDVQFQMNSPPPNPPPPHPTPSIYLSPIDSQSIKRKPNRRMTIYITRPFLQVGFCFQYQFINLVWLSFDFFSFSRSLTICFFVALYSCVCVVQKYHEMSFIYNYLHF